MPYSETGLLADPAYRHERARKARAAQSDPEHLARKLAESAPGLPPDLPPGELKDYILALVRSAPGLTPAKRQRLVEFLQPFAPERKSR